MHNQEPAARIGLRVSLSTLPAGPVEIVPMPDHRVTIHAGPPARGACLRQRHVYTRGDINILPAGLPSAWHDDDPATSLVVCLPPALLRRAAEDIGIDPARAGLETRHQLRDPQIEHVAWALDAEQRAGSPNGRLYADSLGLAFAIHLLGRYAAPLALRDGLSARQQRRVTDYVEAYLDQPLTLLRLARVAEVSASHLKTLFKRSMGLPVHEYVIQRRVERARTLLLRGELPASQVALEAGFAHQSHMARCMRRVLGVTPSALSGGVRTRTSRRS
jgi:AraC family transcriptional regulator